METDSEFSGRVRVEWTLASTFYGEGVTGIFGDTAAATAAAMLWGSHSQSIQKILTTFSNK